MSFIHEMHISEIGITYPKDLGTKLYRINYYIKSFSPENQPYEFHQHHLAQFTQVNISDMDFIEMSDEQAISMIESTYSDTIQSQKSTAEDELNKMIIPVVEI